MSLIWGSQYFFNKIALESFSSLIVMGSRVAIGSIVLTLLLVAGIEKKKAFEPQCSSWHYLPDFILIGFFEATLPFFLIAWAQKQVPSSVTAILIGTVPLFATILEALFIKDHTISGKKLIAIPLGFLGVIVLVGPGLFSSNIVSSLSTSLPLIPVLALLGASLSFSISVSLIKARLSSSVRPIRSAQGILTGATITALPCVLWLTPSWKLTTFHFTLFPFTSLILLGIFGGGIVYTLYVRLIERAGPSFASSANYLALPIGAFIGIFLGGEKLTPNVIASLLLILTALWLSKGKGKI